MDSFSFIDVDTSSEVYCSIRTFEDCIGLGFSIREDGDFEVFLHREDAQKLLTLVDAALSRASSAGSVQGSSPSG